MTIHQRDPNGIDIATDPAITMLFVQIGETVKTALRKGLSLPPGVEWEDAARTRDKLVHHYDGLDRGIIVQTIERDIKEMLKILKKASV